MQDNLTIKLVSWLLAWRQLVVVLLLVMVVASALGVAVSTHMTRQMFASLQSIGLRSDELESEYEKLLLEQSAWADYARIDQLSRSELSMRAPMFKDIVVVER